MDEAERAWQAWASDLAEALGLKAHQAGMLRRWRSLLEEGGATPGVVARATDRALTCGEPTYGLAGLLQMISREAAALSAPKAEDAGPCPEPKACAICGGLDAGGFAREAVGRVSVPDPDRLAERRTCVVYCRCPLGRWFRASAPAIKVRGKDCRVLTIDDVCGLFEAVEDAPDPHGPGWRGYASWWRELANREAGLLEEARAADREGGRLRMPSAGEVLNRWRQKGGGR